MAFIPETELNREFVVALIPDIELNREFVVAFKLEIMGEDKFVMEAFVAIKLEKILFVEKLKFAILLLINPIELLIFDISEIIGPKFEDEEFPLSLLLNPFRFLDI